MSNKPTSRPDSDEITDRSSYPELKKPIFHDNIPSHLLAGIDDQSRYIIQQLSMISQQNEWLISAAIDTNAQVRHTNGRVLGLEEWKRPIEEADVAAKLDKLEDWKKSLDDKNILSKVKAMDKFSNFWTVLIAILVLLASLSGIIVALLHSFHVSP